VCLDSKVHIPELFDVVGNIPQMAMRTIELIEEFYENTMATPTHICQYKVSDDKKWIEDVVKKY